MDKQTEQPPIQNKPEKRPASRMSRLLLAGALAFGGATAVKETANYLDEHGARIGVDMAGRFEGSSEILLGVMDEYSHRKVESNFLEKYSEIPEENPELQMMDVMLQDAVAEYQNGGGTVRFGFNPNRKDANYYFDHWEDVVGDLTISEVLKYKGFTRPGGEQGPNPIDDLKLKAFEALGEDVNVILLLADRFHNYPYVVTELEKFKHTFSSFYTRPNDALAEFARERGISLEEVSDEDREKVYTDAMRDYMKEVYNAVVPGGLPEKDGFLEDDIQRAEPNDVLLYFLDMHDGDLRLALLDTSLFFKILTRQDLENGNWIYDRNEMLEAVRLTDRFVDPISAYGGRFGIANIRKYEPGNFNPDDIPLGYGEGSPFNIIGEIYAIYGAALTLRDYPPDVVASIWGVHVQAEAGPESQVQSLDEAVSIIRQLKRINETDDYLHGLDQEGGKTSERHQLNSVRDRLRAMSEEQAFRAKDRQKKSSISRGKPGGHVRRRT